MNAEATRVQRNWPELENLQPLECERDDFLFPLDPLVPEEMREGRDYLRSGWIVG